MNKAIFSTLAMFLWPWFLIAEVPALVLQPDTVVTVPLDSGEVVGQIPVWDGEQWVLSDSSQVGNVLRIDASGMPSWQEGMSTASFVVGCLDPEACNYDAQASLSFSAACDYSSCLGCVDEEFVEFNPDALIDDGSCERRLGCTNEEASNFNPAADVNDGTCEFYDLSLSLSDVSQVARGQALAALAMGDAPQQDYSSYTFSVNGEVVQDGESPYLYFSAPDSAFVIWASAEYNGIEVFSDTVVVDVSVVLDEVPISINMDLENIALGDSGVYLFSSVDSLLVPSSEFVNGVLSSTLSCDFSSGEETVVGLIWPVVDSVQIFSLNAINVGDTLELSYASSAGYLVGLSTLLLDSEVSLAPFIRDHIENADGYGEWEEELMSDFETGQYLVLDSVNYSRSDSLAVQLNALLPETAGQILSSSVCPPNLIQGGSLISWPVLTANDDGDVVFELCGMDLTYGVRAFWVAEDQSGESIIDSSQTFVFGPELKGATTTLYDNVQTLLGSPEGMEFRPRSVLGSNVIKLSQLKGVNGTTPSTRHETIGFVVSRADHGSFGNVLGGSFGGGVANDVGDWEWHVGRNLFVWHFIDLVLADFIKQLEPALGCWTANMSLFSNLSSQIANVISGELNESNYNNFDWSVFFSSTALKAYYNSLADCLCVLNEAGVNDAGLVSGGGCPPGKFAFKVKSQRARDLLRSMKPPLLKVLESTGQTSSALIDVVWASSHGSFQRAIDGKFVGVPIVNSDGLEGLRVSSGEIDGYPDDGFLVPEGDVNLASVFSKTWHYKDFNLLSHWGTLEDVQTPSLKWADFMLRNEDGLPIHGASAEVRTAYGELLMPCTFVSTPSPWRFDHSSEELFLNDDPYDCSEIPGSRTNEVFGFLNRGEDPGLVCDLATTGSWLVRWQSDGFYNPTSWGELNLMPRIVPQFEEGWQCWGPDLQGQRARSVLNLEYDLRALDYSVPSGTVLEQPADIGLWGDVEYGGGTGTVGFPVVSTTRVEDSGLKVGLDHSSEEAFVVEAQLVPEGWEPGDDLLVDRQPLTNAKFMIFFERVPRRSDIDIVRVEVESSKEVAVKWVDTPQWQGESLGLSDVPCEVRLIPLFGETWMQAFGEFEFDFSALDPLTDTGLVAMDIVVSVWTSCESQFGEPVTDYSLFPEPWVVPVEVELGCMDECANNFDPQAVIQPDGDGWCQYDGVGCDGETSMSYGGYTYDLVEIGSQCWFAENLRTTAYANGDLIPADLEGAEGGAANFYSGEWFDAVTGGSAVYGLDSTSNCSSPSSFDFDACDPNLSLAAWGRLYNWYAVDDARGLCPVGWHVPTKEEWEQLIDYVECQGFDYLEHQALSSTTGWNYNSGTDNFGFSALPGGRRVSDGDYSGGGSYAFLWTSTYGEVNTGPGGIVSAPLYYLFNGSYLSLWHNVVSAGMSVRCLKDAE